MTAEVHRIANRRSIGNVKGLLHSLVPRATCFAFYNVSRACTWSSDGADDYELDNFVTDLPEEILLGREPDSTFLRRTLASGRTILLLTVSGEGTDALGVLIAVFSRNAGKASWFNPNLIREILLPVVDVIRENLYLGTRLSLSEQRAAAVEKELKLVYTLDEKVHGTSRSHSGLAQLVGQSGRYLGVAYSVLLLPAKRIRISATHSSWKHVNRKSLDKYLIDVLFPKLVGEDEPVVFAVPPSSNHESPADQGFQVMLSPLHDAAGNVEGAVAQLGRINGESFTADNKRFMSHVVRKVEHLIKQSFDVMTGLMNRSGFEAQIHESMGQLETSRDVHQMVYFDLDNLQLVNDTFGQQAGDDVIKRFGQMIEEQLPRNGIATRLTGDDFAILLTHSSEEDAMALATNLRGCSDQLRYLKGDKSLQVTVSAGIAPFTAQVSDESEILKSARIACDSAKDHGRDRIEVYDQQNQSIIRRFDDMNLVTEIQRSLDADALELHAQPIVSLSRKGAAPRFEILLRMRDTDGKCVSTTAFFSAAERYQLMPQIDRWVVSTTISSLQP
ncbi:MAG: diguanylate cyclase, partial [Woeseia sp.]